jgi:SAM-dependent methyltransferase
VPLWDLLDLRLLDVRPQEEFTRAHIPDAASIPCDQLEDRGHELPRERDRLLVVAADASEAAAVASSLREPGGPTSAVVADRVTAWPGPWETGPPRRVLWEPSPTVRAWAARLPAGRVLDLGCGSGRDAAYLAVAGHDVLAVDRLPEALARAETLARRVGAAIRTVRMDLRRERPPAEGGFDLVLMVRYLERDLLPWVAQTLRPGGCFILEAFARPTEDLPGPRRDRWILEPQEVLHAVLAGPGRPAWQVLEYAEGAVAEDLPLTRLVARRL